MPELEERYIVIKRSHLCPNQEVRLREWLNNWEVPIGTIDCVVVEKDWDMYEETVQKVLND